MELFDQIAQLGGWAWIAAGFLLIVIELLVSGTVIIWFGLAALVVGVATFVQPIGMHIQWIMFGILSIVSVFVWRRYANAKMPENDKPNLNKRAHQYLGRVVAAHEGFEDGKGRLKLDDTLWLAQGEGVAEGDRVRIVGAEGNVLLVESVN